VFLVAASAFDANDLKMTPAGDEGSDLFDVDEAAF